MKVFFLAAVAIAGIYGAATVNRRILVVQTVPALLALAAVIAAGLGLGVGRRADRGPVGRHGGRVRGQLASRLPALPDRRPRDRGADERTQGEAADELGRTRIIAGGRRAAGQAVDQAWRDQAGSWSRAPLRRAEDRDDRHEPDPDP